ncbi:LOW QUALITY PROTEIN: C-C chemokine receptor type 7-like [Spinachia spinachia]
MEEPDSSVVPSNISSSDGDPLLTAWVSNNLIPALVLSICFLLGVPGNIVVIVLRPNWQHLSSLSQSLLLNLAISGLLSLLSLPVWIYMFLYSWTLELATCTLTAHLVYCSLYSSLLTVTGLSVQRYLQVVKLQRSSCCGAIILSVPSLVTQQPNPENHRRTCGPHHSSAAQQVAVLLTESVPGLASIAMVAFSYISLYGKVNEAAFFHNPQTTRLVTSITVTFFVLRMPYIITNVLMLLKSGMRIQNTFGALVPLCTVCKKREHGYCC